MSADAGGDAQIESVPSSEPDSDEPEQVNEEVEQVNEDEEDYEDVLNLWYS